MYMYMYYVAIQQLALRHRMGKTTDHAFIFCPPAIVRVCLILAQELSVAASVIGSKETVINKEGHPIYFWARVMFWPVDPAKNAIQGDAPEGNDTF